jgi:hypothetical protein
MKAFQATRKRETLVLGPVERHLLSRPADTERRQDRIHPSEMCKDDWCHRATFYRLAGCVPVEKDKAPSMRLEAIYEAGHEIHHKWQGWLWEAGILNGVFECLRCEWQEWATAPERCPQCSAPRRAMRYREVPIASEEHLIIGHSDGDLGSSLLEVKSIGVGTVRFEAPHLLSKHTHEYVDEHGDTRSWTDLEALWRSIKRPFNSHLKQGWIYCHFTGRPRISYLYECKWNQAHREFIIRYRPEYVEPLLDACLDIKYALKTNSAPPCPVGGTEGCSECRKYESVAGDTEPDGGDVEERPVRKVPPRKRRLRSSTTTRGRDSSPGREGLDRPDRSEADAPPRPLHSLGRLLER